MQHSTEENQPLNVTLWSLDRSHPYLKSRGIAPETAEVFGVGFFSGQGPLVGRVVIPIHNGVGQLVGNAGRAVGTLTDPKYIMVPSDFRPDRELFNLHRTIAAAKTSRSGVVVVVEGFFDCMRVHQAGFHCVVSLMGSDLSERQEVLLVENFERVLLMLDGDDEGWRAAQGAITRLASQRFVRAVILPSGRKPDELSDEEIRATLGS